MKTTLKIFCLLIPVLILFLMTSCSDPVEYTEEDTSSTSYETGMIRFIHSASTTDYLLVNYRDLDTDSYETFLSGTEYGSQYGYYNFRTGEREFISYESNTSFIIAAVSFALEENKKYSIIAYDHEATLNPGFMVLEDTLASADSALSFVRFIHLGSDIGTITVNDTVNAEKIVELDRKEYSSYLTLQARTYIFDVKLKSLDQLVISGIPATFLSGMTYTVIFSGSVNGLTPVEFNLNCLRDASIKYITVD